MCKVCDRPDVDSINASLKLRTLREVSKQYGLAKETLRRHTLHMVKLKPEQVAEVVDLASRRTPRPRGVDRRLLQGQMLASVAERLAVLDSLIAKADCELDDPALGLRERHMVLRSMVGIHREVRGYLELAIKTGAMNVPDVQTPEAATVDDVRRMVAELQAELDAVEGC